MNRSLVRFEYEKSPLHTIVYGETGTTDMGDRLNKDIAYYFTEGRHNNIQMIVMCHKPAQIINTARMSCDTI